MNIQKAPEATEFIQFGMEPIATVEQALEVVHLLPPEDPIRLSILHACGRRLIAAMVFVGAAISTKNESPIL